MSSKIQFVLKRFIDILLSLIGLVLLAMPFGLIAVAIKLDSKGPVFFRQERTGKASRVFMPWKFRTMVVGAVDQGLLLQKGAEVSYNDPYVSSFAYLEQQWESQSLNEGLLQE